MPDSERLITFELLGQKFQFYSAASEAEIRSILDLVRASIDPGENRSAGTLPTGKVAVLACLNMASRHLKLQQQLEDYRRDVEEKTGQLNLRIRSVLTQE